jgi:Bacterial Ig-like domain
VRSQRSTQNPRNAQSKVALRFPWVLRLTSCLLLAIVAGGADAQLVIRRATNLTEVLAYPGFYNGRPIVLIGKVESDKDGRLTVSDDAGSVHLLTKNGAPDGLDEVRGEFWDLGRMKPEDLRLVGYDLKATFKIDPNGAWPRPGEVTAIIANAVTAAAAPQAPSIRAIVLNPGRYLDQKVTLTGQYSGRNLLGEQPDAPGKSRYDFVLRSSDAAIWVINMRPKLKDATGKDLELALDGRLDTGRWLTVRGTVQQGHGLQWLDAEAGSLALAKPPTETRAAEEVIRVPAGPPPEVIFSAPTAEETDVPLVTTVRIQFSRDIDQSTLKGRVSVQYVGGAAAAPGEAATPIAVTLAYAAASRVLEVHFPKPFERFRTVKIDLLDGIMGTDAQPLKPWSLTFGVGGA